MRLIRTILLIPFYIYYALWQWVVKLVLKLTYVATTLAESVPVVGPRVTRLVNWLSKTKFILWIQKFKVE
jgi:hypothetical protein